MERTPEHHPPDDSIIAPQQDVLSQVFVEADSLHLCLILYTCGQGCDGNT